MPIAFELARTNAPEREVAADLPERGQVVVCDKDFAAASSSRSSATTGRPCKLGGGKGGFSVPRGPCAILGGGCGRFGVGGRRRTVAFATLNKRSGPEDVLRRATAMQRRSVGLNAADTLRDIRIETQ